MIHTNICCEVFLWTKLVWNFVSKNIGSAKLFYSTISETFKILLEHFQGHRGMETIAFVDSVKYWGLALLQGRSRVDWNFAEGTTSKVQGKANCCECPRLIQAWTCVWTCTTRTTKKKNLSLQLNSTWRKPLSVICGLGTVLEWSKKCVPPRAI